MGKETCHIKTEIIINKPPKEVRDVFFDFGKYPEWNPSLKSVDLVSGNIEDVNTKPVLRSLIATPPSEEGFYNMTVVQNDAEEFRIEAGILTIMIARYYRFETYETDKTRFIHGETFRGFGSGLLSKFVNLVNIEKGLVLMNEALKKRCEEQRR